MCRFVAFLFVAMVGCSSPEAWKPSHAPLQVTLPSDASDVEISALMAGVARWREELGEDVIRVTVSDHVTARCGHVDVSFASMRGVVNGTTVRRACRASILLGSDMPEAYMGVVAAHELGHALGLDHDDDPGSLMYESAPRDGGYLTDHALEYVSDLLR